MIKLVIVLLIIACIASMFIKGPDGEPLMTVDDWKVELPATISTLLFPGESDVPDVSPVEPLTVYKWQDEEGQWHFSNTPRDMATAEVVELSQVNIMDAYVPSAVTSEQAASVEAPKTLATGAMTATPDQVKEMMETVTNLQETVDQRPADMEAVAGFED